MNETTRLIDDIRGQRAAWEKRFALLDATTAQLAAAARATITRSRDLLERTKAAAGIDQNRG